MEGSIVFEGKKAHCAWYTLIVSIKTTAAKRNGSFPEIGRAQRDHIYIYIYACFLRKLNVNLNVR